MTKKEFKEVIDKYKKLEKEVKSKDQEIENLKNQLEFLQNQILNKNRKMFGKSSEQADENQLPFFNEADKSNIITSDALKSLLHKSMASNELLAHILTMKCQQALPLY